MWEYLLLRVIPSVDILQDQGSALRSRRGGRMFMCPLLHLPVDPFDKPSHLSLKLLVNIDAGGIVMDKLARTHGILRRLYDMHTYQEEH
jgi:hypothetical protein